MKELIVKRISEAIAPEALSAVMNQQGIDYQPIAEVNWANFPYAPQVAFRMAYNNEGLLINYKVKEQSVRAKYGEDNGSVWTDSCVELFLIPADDQVYYNIECNCVGTVLVGAGAERAGRERASKAITQLIRRWSSLGREPFEERQGPCEWEISLVIPNEVFFKHQITSFAGKKITANAYKCGDELSTPHFLSWNRIDIPKPNFHRPDFFGSLVFSE